MRGRAAAARRVLACAILLGVSLLGVPVLGVPVLGVFVVVGVSSGVSAQRLSPPPAAPPETPRALGVEEAVARTLASPRYRFCFDPKYPLLPDEAGWCPTLPSSPDPHATRCPSFLGACRAGATANLLHKRKPFNISLPNFGGVGRAVLWLLAAAAVGSLFFFVGRYAFRLPTEARRGETDPKPGQSRPLSSGVADDAVERDVERLLARAQAQAAGGHFSAGIADLHAALFRCLEGEGHIRIHLSATNGDYLRELKGRTPALAGPVGDVVRDVETAEFGVTLPGEGAYRSLLERVTPLLARSVGVMTAPAPPNLMLLALVLGFVTLLAACQPSLRQDWSASPSGSAAVAEFLTHAGLTTRERIAPLGDLGKAKEKPATAAQIVLLPGAEIEDGEWAVLGDWLRGEDKTLVVATGPRSLPSWLADVEVVTDGAPGPLRATKMLADAGVSARSTGRVPGSAWVRTGISESDALIVRGDRTYAVQAVTDVGRVIVLADDRLFVNAALVVDENAALLAALLRAGGGPIEFVGEDTGVVAPNPVASVARGRLAPFLAQLGACLILFLLMKGRAFGRLVDPTVAHRRVFSEHVRALGTQYARARAAGHALGAYATWALDRLRERIRISGDRGIGDLSAAVAARTDRPLGEVARVLFSARRDGDTRGGGAESTGEDRSRAAVDQHLAMMRKLAQILAETSASATSRAKLATRSRKVRRTDTTRDT